MTWSVLKQKNELQINQQKEMQEVPDLCARALFTVNKSPARLLPNSAYLFGSSRDLSLASLRTVLRHALGHPKYFCGKIFNNSKLLEGLYFVNVLQRTGRCRIFSHKC